MSEVAPWRFDNGVSGLSLPASELLIKAPWPQASAGLGSEDAQASFEKLQQIIGSIREARTTHKVPPRQRVTVSVRCSDALQALLTEQRATLEALASCDAQTIGGDIERPSDAASAVIGDAEVYVHGVLDVDTERKRLDKRAEELASAIANFEKRLSNEKYVNNAPQKLVKETRDQLEAAQDEAKRA